jgi:hypothetical protein
MPSRRACLAGGLALLVSMPHARALDLYDEPRVIVENLLERYTDPNTPDLAMMPFVPRIHAALVRTDLAIDPVINASETRVSLIRVAATRMVDDKRATVEARFRNLDVEKHAVFEFDRTSGDWLIADIRHGNGITLRTLVQIPAPR